MYSLTLLAYAFCVQSKNAWVFALDDVETRVDLPMLCRVW